MSETSANLRRKMDTARDLQSVVTTMKAVAASSLGQYERATHALSDYHRTVQLGLMACLRDIEHAPAPEASQRHPTEPSIAVVFGSDQGLVGSFNDVMADFVLKTIGHSSKNTVVWTVGERLRARLVESKLSLGKSFTLAGSIGAITPLVGQVLVEIEAQSAKGVFTQVDVFHHSAQTGAVCRPTRHKLLPLDEAWRQACLQAPWPTQNLPEVMNGVQATLRAFVREYLFVSLFKACAQSLASENASRLAAMQRAEKNMESLLEELERSFNQLRQSDIDEELFDVIAGFEALQPLPVHTA